MEQCVPYLHSDHEKSQLNSPVWGSLRSPNKSVSLASLVCFSIFGLYFNYNNILLQYIITVLPCKFRTMEKINLSLSESTLVMSVPFSSIVALNSSVDLFAETYVAVKPIIVLCGEFSTTCNVVPVIRGGILQAYNWLGTSEIKVRASPTQNTVLVVDSPSTSTSFEEPEYSMGSGFRV